MSELETQSAASEATAASEEVTGESKKKGSSLKWFLAAGVVVLLIILGVLYQLEKEGRSSTNLFASVIEWQQANAVVATVNGKEIIGSELAIGVKQFTQLAEAQGVDITDAEVQSEIRDQALQVLVNTELLKQEAAERGMAVTDEEVTTRLEAIKEELGGEEVLGQRIAELGIEADQLHADIKEELIIKQLLDAVFAESAIEVTEEEIQAAYDGAGGEEAGLPALDDVKEQVKEQLVASKQQVAVDEFINKLKSESNIEIPE